MSKLNKRKTVGDLIKVSGSLSKRDIQKRPSVFERLGTKASCLTSLSVVAGSQSEPFCRNWLQNGTCSYGSSCPQLITHTLISSSKRNSVKESDLIQNCLLPDDSRRRSPDINWEVWDQSELECEDEKVLEKRLQLLQKELELQMKRDTKKKDVLKQRSSSTSSSGTSTSGSSSTSRSTTVTNSSSNLKEEDKKNLKRQTNPSPIKESSSNKDMGKSSGTSRDSPSRKTSSSNKSSPLSRRVKRKTPTPPRKGSSPKPKSFSSSSSSSRKKDSDRDRLSRNDRKRSVSRSRRPPSPRFSKSSRSTTESSRSNPRPRSSERSDKKRDDDKKSRDDFRRDRKSDYRDRRDRDDSRSREKAREAAREKERMEALERCRERQREREQLAKERERKEGANSSSVKRDYDKNKRDRKDRKDVGKDRFDKRPSDDKDKKSRGDSRDHSRRDRSYDRKGDREKSYDRERARDRALERIMMERKSLEKRPRDDRSTTSRRMDDTGGDRSSHYDSDRIYKNISPSRDDHIRLSQHYSSDDRHSRRRVGESSRERGWESRYDDAGSKQPRGGDWAREGSSSRLDYTDRRSDWSRLGGAPEEEGEGDWNYANKDWRRQNTSAQPDDRRSRSRRDSKEKDNFNKEGSKENDISGDASKRSRESNEPAPEPKRIRLEEELSDISDEADEILNREDVEDTYVEDSYIMAEECGIQGEERSNDENDCRSLSLEQRMLESRMGDDEGMDNLDFEEISDEELEEEAKFGKGGSVGDALGVDWASLMADCKPERKTPTSTSARDRWLTQSIMSKMGLSCNLAGPKMSTDLKEKYKLKSETGKNNQLGIVYKTLSNRLLTRSNLFNISGKHKRALSARSDIFIRRQLCYLPVSDLDAHQTIGQCQWVV